jgi:hypothetical protein
LPWFPPGISGWISGISNQCMTRIAPEHQLGALGEKTCA